MRIMGLALLLIAPVALSQGGDVVIEDLAPPGASEDEQRELDERTQREREQREREREEAQRAEEEQRREAQEAEERRTAETERREERPRARRSGPVPSFWFVLPPGQER